MLIVIRKNEGKGDLSKRELADMTGINHNCIVKWRKQYMSEGI